MDTAYSQPPSTGELGLMIVFPTVLAIVYVIAAWRIFTKAGKPGWAAIVPFYNIYILLQILGRPGWWLFLYFIPGVNIIVSIINALDLAKVFGKSSVFGIVGLWLFGFIGYLILGFGKDEYIDPQSGSTPLSTTPPGIGSVTPVNKPVVAQPVAAVTEKPLIQDVTPITQAPAVETQPSDPNKPAA